MSDSTEVMVLGVSSWLGHELVRLLATSMPPDSIKGIYRQTFPSWIDPRVGLVRFSDPVSIEELIATVVRLRPRRVVHLARGEDADAFHLQIRLIDAVNRIGAHYSYLSSMNVFDADLSRPHGEDDPPRAASAYGMFKQRCEGLIRDRCQAPWSIFRLAQMHGFAPNRLGRTQEFLATLGSGADWVVREEMVQNRLCSADVAAMIAAVVTRRAEGIFHLGAIDSSSQVEFLRGLAVRFGHVPERVVDQASSTVDATVVPGRIFEVMGDLARISESQTLERLGADPGLISAYSVRSKEV